MPTKTISSRQPLVKELAARIAAPQAAEEPYIVQDRVPQTRSRHVVVIWDAWEDLDASERGRIITDAFARAGIDDIIQVAMGVTQQEAIDSGYFPYRIIANLKGADGKKVSTAVRKAMEQAPGVQVRIGSSLQLRYPTLEHAQEAYRELSAAVPGPYWAIVKDDGGVE